MTESETWAFLEEQRAKLARLTPYPWTNMEAWIAETRVCIVQLLPGQVVDFDHRSSAPKWSHTIRWMIGDADNIDSATALEKEHHIEQAETRRSELVTFISSLLRLRPASAPAATGGPTYITNNIANVHNSTVAAVAVGEGPLAKGKLKLPK